MEKATNNKTKLEIEPFGCKTSSKKGILVTIYTIDESISHD